MAFPRVSVLLGFAVFLAVICTGYSLQCYQCSLHGNEKGEGLTNYGPEDTMTECQDEFNPDDHSDLLKVCENKNATACGKSKTISKAGNVIYKRYCAMTEEIDECKISYGNAANSWICKCSEDGCNGASNLRISSFLLCVLALFTVISLRR